MYRISKRFDFSAGHFLDGLPTEHPCSRPHGHNYCVEIELAAYRLDDVGFVVDYRALDEFKKWLDENFDHRVLNDALDFNPTAENLAKHCYEEAARRFNTHGHDVEDIHVYVVAARVKETEKTCAEYMP